MSRSRAYQLIDAAKVVKILSTSVNKGDFPAPENECQVRPLAKLSEEDVELAWELAAEKAGDKPITGKVVQDAINELQGKEPGNRLHKLLSGFQRGSEAITKAAKNFPPADWDQNEVDRFKANLKPILKIAVDAAIMTTEAAVLNSGGSNS